MMEHHTCGSPAPVPALLDIDSEHEHYVENPVPTKTLSSSSGQGDEAEESLPKDDGHHYSCSERLARRVARSPKTYFWTALLLSITVSGLGMYFGDFSVDFGSIGWPSRGTLVADRHTQYLLVSRNRRALKKRRNDLAWRDITTIVQPGWETQRGVTVTEAEDEDEDERRRRHLLSSLSSSVRLAGDNGVVMLQGQNDDFLETIGNRELYSLTIIDGSSNTSSTLTSNGISTATNSSVNGSNNHTNDSNITTAATSSNSTEEKEKPEGVSPTDFATLWDRCDVPLYTRPEMLDSGRLWPVFKVMDNDASALDPPLLRDLCLAEEQTQKVLHKKKLCFGCDDGQCLPPLSIVLYARLTVPNGLALNCYDLAEGWAPYQAEVERDFRQCFRHLQTLENLQDLAEDRGPCPVMFSPTMVDNSFDKTGRVAYTSSVFVTHGGEHVNLYKLSDKYGTGTGQLQGAYDTQYFRFMEYAARDNVGHDLYLAGGSALVTTLAMLAHTRSPFLTLIGIIQISLSFPLAYTVYRCIGGIIFFPFLNLVGIFVSFALGADHVFVAVDKWKNARLDHPNATTEEIAGNALPGAGRAMVLTTITTAIAFFGSSVCPVLPVKLFGIFCGLLIAIDYILDVLVMFPCLCIYDGYRSRRNCCMDINCFRRAPADEEEAAGQEESRRPSEEMEEEKAEEDHDCSNDKQDATITGQEHSCPTDSRPENMSLIRRILYSYYAFLHRWRWPILALSVAALCVCSYFATTLRPPPNPNDIQILLDSAGPEKAKRWRYELMFTTLLTQSGGLAYVMWGTVAADTGNHLDPYTFSELVLDESFDPSPRDAQIYMRDFCSTFFDQDFADLEVPDFVCSINLFDDWLEEQSLLPLVNQTNVYTENCDGATALPTAEDVFHPCLSAWAHEQKDGTILSWDGVVKVITLPFKSRVRVDVPTSVLGKEWNLIEDWMKQHNKNAPSGVDRSFFTAFDFWFWDTSVAVYQTAIESGAIAIGVSALVILITSRSLLMTFFSAISVAFVLVSVASFMVAAKWTLGFLESICLTILIGLSADFVLHFSHAYCELPGDVDRHTRSKYALIHLGPSILAAGFTTLAGAFTMSFTLINFWRLFALVLLFTIVQATIGSFVVFLVFADTIGPSNPTYLMDLIISKFAGLFQRGEEKPPPNPTAQTNRST